ncbi:PREDICTED: olfactory receptor-like protein OLF3 [Nanorana parkeri]|uniref:olfactory receptor-like protein OLF3 n=1 Tax=Nanorana parkeri TaxID=125878 RepID=UPI0008540A07|nr:PREDICTED: olfactory receptor-like protein OLF3 [Nanorana parkeri]
MDPMNRTFITEIILLGFSTNLKINIVLFFLFSVIYVITVVGNVLIISLVIISYDLHTPMYFFLCILSFVDLCNSSSVVPRLLSDLFSVRRAIPLSACAFQVYVALLMGGTECLPLAIMAYDRFVAICRPLHYYVIMRWSICHRLAIFLWVTSFIVFVFPSLATPMALCNPNEINHFMCELLAVMKLTCQHVYSSELLVMIVCFSALLLPFLFIIGTYISIIHSVLKIHTGQRFKAFATCSSHITVVVLFYGAAMVMNFGASSQYSTSQGKYISIFYNVICPMLNPVIYSLNNTDVKKKFKSFLKQQDRIAI